MRKGTSAPSLLHSLQPCDFSTSPRNGSLHLCGHCEGSGALVVSHYREGVHTRVLFSLKILIYFLEKGEGKEKGTETSMCERNTDRLPLIHPQWGPCLQSRHVFNQELNSDVLVHSPGLIPLNQTSQGNIRVIGWICTPRFGAGSPLQ